MSDTLLASFGAVKGRADATYPLVSAQGLGLMCGTGFHRIAYTCSGRQQNFQHSPLPGRPNVT